MYHYSYIVIYRSLFLSTYLTILHHNLFFIISVICSLLDNIQASLRYEPTLIYNIMYLVKCCYLLSIYSSPSLYYDCILYYMYLSYMSIQAITFILYIDNKRIYIVQNISSYRSILYCITMVSVVYVLYMLLPHSRTIIPYGL